ncbi:hypothetical protein G3O08_09385 [Cryomorpha ignava]|uniref:Uncharacterized protein n=1 Tax=Cryomorpha ignava TaxID=101383 RepID=A0A7K3WRN8_9FLAO|nr:DUF6155 family protein [Cryomorpha ignava]NEN23711.1 hypothetical protein [Cryomorpha ignava]
MSKRDLQNYLKDLTKKQLNEQILDLYERFKDVKVYYDFAFNPQEDKLIDDFKTRVGKEYFPPGKRKPKMRRSVAQKLIKHFITIEVEPSLLLDAMLFNIETAQAFTFQRTINQESFYKSMLNSFEQAVNHAKYHGLLVDSENRFIKIIQNAQEQKWLNYFDFGEVMRDK